MNRDTYYALCHEARFAKFAERKRRQTRRDLKRAHKAWRFNQAMKRIQIDNVEFFIRLHNGQFDFGSL